jgi:hypothetical protein
MYRQLTLACALCLGATSQATEMNKLTDSVRVTRVSTSELMHQPIEPTYLAGVTETSPWKGHWFLSAGAGVNVFAGDPLGCGDMFDRMRPAYTFSVGKWFTPSIGGRIAFSGFQMKDACFEWRTIRASMRTSSGTSLPLYIGIPKTLGGSSRRMSELVSFTTTVRVVTLLPCRMDSKAVIG